MAFLVFRYTLTWSAAYSILARTPIVRNFDTHFVSDYGITASLLRKLDPYNLNKKDAKINEFFKLLISFHLFLCKLNYNHLSFKVSL